MSNVLLWKKIIKAHLINSGFSFQPNSEETQPETQAYETDVTYNHFSLNTSLFSGTHCFFIQFNTY